MRDLVIKDVKLTKENLKNLIESFHDNLNIPSSSLVHWSEMITTPGFDEFKEGDVFVIGNQMLIPELDDSIATIDEIGQWKRTNYALELSFNKYCKALRQVRIYGINRSVNLFSNLNYKINCYQYEREVCDILVKLFPRSKRVLKTKDSAEQLRFICIKSSDSYVVSKSILGPDVDFDLIYFGGKTISAVEFIEIYKPLLEALTY